MAHRFDHVARPGFALGADHRRAFVDAAQRFAQVAAAADERHLELVLVDVVFLVGGGEYFALVDVVDSNRFQNLRLDEMPDAHFRHHRNGHGVHDAVDQVGVAHAGDAAVRADVRRDALQRHDGAGARVLGDLRLFGRHHVHDHAALEHLRQPTLQGVGSGFAVMTVIVHA